MVKVYSSNSVFTVSVPALLAPALAGSVTVTVSAMASSLPVPDVLSILERKAVEGMISQALLEAMVKVMLPPSVGTSSS